MQTTNVARAPCNLEPETVSRQSSTSTRMETVARSEGLHEDGESASSHSRPAEHIMVCSMHTVTGP